MSLKKDASVPTILLAEAPPGSVDAVRGRRFRARLYSGGIERFGPTQVGVIRRFLAYLRGIGWDGEAHSVQSEPWDQIRRADAAPVFVVKNPDCPGQWIATLSGAPHLPGYGKTPEEADAACREVLRDHGFEKMAGETVWPPPS